MIINIRTLNNQGLYTIEQLMKWKKFEGKYLNVYSHHYTYWQDGKGYVTVFEIRGISDEVRENYLTVDEIAERI